MIHYLPITDFPNYDVHVSKKLLATVDRQGLIEPLVVMPDGSIYKYHQELFMAFKQSVSSRIIADRATHIIAVYWTDLTPNERKGL